MNEKTINIIIPVHVWNEETKKCLDNIEEKNPDDGYWPKKYIVGTKEVCDEIDEYFGDTFFYLHNKTGDTSIQKQINLGFESIKCDYIIYLEMDDFLMPSYLDNLYEHIQRKNDMAMYLPLTLQTDYEDKKSFLGFSNEIFWSRALFVMDEDDKEDFSETKNLDGVLDLKYFLKQHILNLTLGGMCVNRQAFLNCGGIKENILFSFMYEFLLRFLYEGHQVIVSNKITYAHTIGKKDSFTNTFCETKMTYDEMRYYHEIAKAEHKYKYGRLRPSFKKYGETINEEG